MLLTVKTELAVNITSKYRAKFTDPLQTGMGPVLSLVIQNLPIGILMVNARGKITHSNPKVESIFAPISSGLMSARERTGKDSHGKRTTA